MNLMKEYKAIMIGLQKYMTNKNDIQVQVILKHQNSKDFHSITKEAETYLNEAATTDDITNNQKKTPTWKAKELILKYKGDYNKFVKDKWRTKAMNNKFPNQLDKEYVAV